MNIKDILTLGVVAVGMTLASCEYTDLSPLDSFTDKTYWRTTNDLKLYANDLYKEMLAGPTASGDATSDNFVTSSYSGYLFNEYIVPPSGGGWSWGAVRNCNYFLKRYDKVQGQEEEINKYVAEVRFLGHKNIIARYAHLVMCHGMIPTCKPMTKNNFTNLVICVTSC